MHCIFQVEYPKDISMGSDENFKRMFYPSYNFTVSIFWSPFLVKSNDPTNPTNPLWTLHLDEPDATWSAELDRFDYVIISAGNWFTRPSLFYEHNKLVGCHYCLLDNVTDLTLRYSHRMAFRTAMKAVVDSNKFNGVVMLRTLSPDHFENGEWNKGGDCKRSRPFGRNEVRLEGLNEELYRAQVEEFEKATVEGVKRGLKMRLVDTTGAMLQRPDGHPSRYGHWAGASLVLYNDCVHWCLPGPIDVWNEFLLHALRL